MANYTESYTATTGDTIDAADFETEFDAIATAIATKLDTDGSGTMTGALNMGSNKVTSVTDPTSAQDAATKAYVDTRASGWTLIASQTASASATISFDASTYAAMFDGTYRAIAIVLNDIIPATDDTYLIARVGTGAGPTYQSSGYVWGGRTQGHTSGADNGSVADSMDTGLAISRVASTVNLGTGAGEALSGTLTGYSVGSAVRVNWHWMVTYLSSGASLQNMVGFGQYGSNTALTGIQFLMSSGNLASGSFSAYGLLV